MASIDASGASLLPWVQEFQVRLPDAAGGMLRWIRGSATPQRGPDGQVLWHGYFEDLTEWHALARADHRQRVAEAANLAKNEFLSRMSHELRTPLNAVLGFAQLMDLDADAPLAASQQRRVALIRQSGEHLLAMIDDLLDLTSIEAGRLPLALQLLDLRPLADDVLALVQAAATRHDLTLACEGHGVQAWGDRTRLRQVLINLLSNAIKYNRPGGQVRVRLLVDGGQAVVQVHDTGLGLSAEDCAQLFQPFNRLGQARGPVEGTGIGLTVTHHLVRLMGGQITVQSTPGVGSCFSVALPMQAPATPAPPGQGTSLPQNTTGPVGWPVGEPPAGSTLTAMWSMALPFSPPGRAPGRSTVTPSARIRPSDLGLPSAGAHHSSSVRSVCRATGCTGRATAARPSALKLATTLPPMPAALPVGCSTTITGGSLVPGCTSSTASARAATVAAPDSPRQNDRPRHHGSAGAAAAVAASGHRRWAMRSQVCVGGVCSSTTAVSGISRACQSATAARSAGWPGSRASKRRRAAPRSVPATYCAARASARCLFA